MVPECPIYCENKGEDRRLYQWSTCYEKPYQYTLILILFVCMVYNMYVHMTGRMRWMNGAQMCVNVTLINKKENKKLKEKLFYLAPNRLSNTTV